MTSDPHDLTRGPSGPLVSRDSAGGLSVAMPEDWQPIASEEHLAAFLAPERARHPSGFTPNLIVTEHPGHVTLSDWWAGMGEALSHPLLLDAAEASDGAAGAVFAQVVAGVSATGTMRLQPLPGRTVVVTVQFASAVAADWLPVAAEMCASLEVGGLP